MSSTTPKLFQPIQFGDVTLQHRIVMAPMTRIRANEAHEHTDVGVEYYAQRASVPGTAIITEATFIAPEAGGYDYVPGIYTDEQIARWKKIADAVHEKGSFIYMQLWALGRAATPSVLAKDGLEYVGAGSIPLDNRGTPRPLSREEIKHYVGLYATAASNAVHKAGLDGVEIHGANGYLVDQFLQTNTNDRTDEYGGSVENRIRFALEVVRAVTEAIGAKKTGIRLSPWNPFQGMRMPDPVPTFRELVTRLRDTTPDLAFIHVIEPRINGIELQKVDHESSDFLREIWGPRPFIAAGGFTREDAIQTAEEKGGLIAIGRMFISNPDLPRRFREGIPLTPYDRNTFYARPADITLGYVDYPFASDVAAKA
ncbi:FMN-linked oxidoreductase [Dentipellis sp. KUC8613]|nr:FMN-linked oxidoreductase [Dentipellis sp. KUC8613]